MKILGTMLAVLWSCAHGLAGEDALQKAVQTPMASKPADTAIKELCTAVGLDATVELVQPEPEAFDVNSIRYLSSRSTKIDGMKIECNEFGGERLYTLQFEQPVPLRKVLDDICSHEGLQWRVQDRKVNVAPLYNFPFSDAAKLDSQNYTFAADTDWRKLIKESIDARSEMIEPLKRDINRLPRTAGLSQPPPELKRPVNGLKGHPAPDAVRAWLLSEAAVRLMDTGNTGERLKLCHVIAAAASAKEIYESNASTDALKDLAEVLRPLSPKNEASKPDRYFLARQLAYGYIAAAWAYQHLRQPSQSIALSKRAAYLGLEFQDDSFFGYYHTLIAYGSAGMSADMTSMTLGYAQPKSGAMWVQTAADDLKALGEAKVGKELLARAHYRLARAYYQTKNIEAAAGQLKLALELDALNGGAHVTAPSIRNLAWVARGHTTVKTQAQATLADVTLDYVEMLRQTGKAAEGAALLEKIYIQRPTDAAFLTSMAHFFKKAELKDKAIDCYKQLLKLTPGEEFVLNDLAQLEGRARMGRNEHGMERMQAPEVVEKYTKIAEVHTSVQRLNGEHKYEEALQVVRAVLKTYPASKDLILQEVLLLIRLDKPKDAESRLTEYEKGNSEARHTSGAFRKMIEAMTAMKAQGAPHPQVPEDF